jgi:hypothetical protein
VDQDFFCGHLKKKHEPVAVIVALHEVREALIQVADDDILHEQPLPTLYSEPPLLIIIGLIASNNATTHNPDLQLVQCSRLQQAHAQHKDYVMLTFKKEGQMAANRILK